jgi:phosphate transport system protein
MRDIYHDELDEIGQTLEAMTQLVQDAMERATRAFLDVDLAGDERVIYEDAHIDGLREVLNRPRMCT